MSATEDRATASADRWSSALQAAVEAALIYVPAARQQDARNAAMAAAMGVLSGTAGEGR